MSDYKIIYENPRKPGAVIRMHPMREFLKGLPEHWTEEEKLIHLADKDLPTGTRYEIVHRDELPDDRFREAWEYTSGENEKTSSELRNEFKAKYGQEG